MRIIRFAVIVAFGFVGFTAQAISLYTWRPTPAIPPLVIGVRDSETPQQAAERYVQGIVFDPELRELLARDPLPSLTMQNFAPLSDSDFTHRVLMIANRPEDYSSNMNWRIDSFVIPFSANGVVPYMVPFVADMGLSDAESDELVVKLDGHFSSFLAMGGDDLDLNPFGRDNSQSKNVVPRRDRFEAKLLRHKLLTLQNQVLRDQGEKSLVQDWLPPFLKDFKRIDRLVGVCRGAQFIALLKGHNLDPDIPGHGGHNERLQTAGEGGELSHTSESPAGEKLHNLRLHPTTNGLTAGVFSRFLDFLHGNSYHHQRIVLVPGDDLEMAADNPEDGVPEVIESRHGNIWLLQLHAELMITRSTGRARQVGLKFMQAISRMLIPMNCEGALR